MHGHGKKAQREGVVNVGRFLQSVAQLRSLVLAVANFQFDGHQRLGGEDVTHGKVVGQLSEGG